MYPASLDAAGGVVAYCSIGDDTDSAVVTTSPTLPNPVPNEGSTSRKERKQDAKE